ncbi:Phosphatidylserine/phosphatidylglycerophosphate/ cardiolipin synthase [Planctomycetales bacterium 10988]|nr:Phosphatidylserine/phosphatidylglycerophosphate/ cardiolipin synthase [Planctomycetales bacterium 10988]
MVSSAWEDFLQKSMEDHRLSRNEKKVLHNAFESLGDDMHQKNVLQSLIFDMARKETIDPETGWVLDWVEGVMQALHNTAPENHATRTEALFSPHDDCAGRIVRLLEAATERIDICVFTITDNRISHAIVNAHYRGVPLRIMTDNEKSHDLGSDISRFRSEGIEVRQDHSEYHMHHKFAIFDNQHLLTGSYNWTHSAAEYNQENLLITNEEKLCQQYSRAFDKLWHLWPE